MLFIKLKLFLSGLVRFYFYHTWELNSIKCFLFLKNNHIIFLVYFVDLVSYTDWCSNVKSTCIPETKPNDCNGLTLKKYYFVAAFNLLILCLHFSRICSWREWAIIFLWWPYQILAFSWYWPYKTKWKEFFLFLKFI